MTGDDHHARVRVLTLNLLAPAHADWSRRREVVRAGLRQLEPDVVALQETVWGDGYDQARDLLGEGFHLARHTARSADGVGAVLASRWPLGVVQEVDLHVTERVQLPWAGAVLAEVVLPPPFGVVLVVHHKPTWEIGAARERELQAVACARFVDQVVGDRDVHVVLLGDLDDAPDSAAVRFWTGRQSLEGHSVAYRDAWEATHPSEAGHTFTPDNPLVTAGEMGLELGRRIDYVMVRCGAHGPSLQVTDCQRVFDAPVGDVWASDHFGVLADLCVPSRPPGAWA
ncbi:endonuclease/exonuclease/phosphatase family protein [Auraticoccus monumenti]|uniref:Metal-dependent hydrolase, endonuclease/exonuclease/phosphatase family n=1 Tax=Auraticoccus monumenti TaxID=675864 RepID=A0A1G6YRX4_9ACTN|nr:endonuclease/exonuclease/phosphatase family protein [Auraticoccus monumenti]SDD92405.1 Metal-dependent hydrolase, endonuclease/exonuclease/phosphatase family [Auraticoccus monumenti]